MDNGEEKRKPKKDERGGTSAWMVTFSDLSTLLLTFFVLLLSMSSMDDRTLKSMFTNFTSACGILYFKEYGEIYRPKEVLIESLYESLQEVLTVKRSEDPVVEEASKTKSNVFGKVGGLEGFLYTLTQGSAKEQSPSPHIVSHHPLISYLALVSRHTFVNHLALVDSRFPKPLHTQ